MYVYFFGYQNDGYLYYMKVDHKCDCPNDPRMIDVFVKPENCPVPYKQELPSYMEYRRYTVPVTEGEVYRRCFWLEKHNIYKVCEIIREYNLHVYAKKTKLTHDQQIKRLKDRISELEEENKHLRQIAVGHII